MGDDGEDLGIFISQPGSSIATSLSDGEQMSKLDSLIENLTLCVPMTTGTVESCISRVIVPSEWNQ